MVLPRKNSASDGWASAAPVGALNAKPSASTRCGARIALISTIVETPVTFGLEPRIGQRTRWAPSPRRGEGWGEGVRNPSRDRNPSPHPSPNARGSRPRSRCGHRVTHPPVSANHDSRYLILDVVLADLELLLAHADPDAVAGELLQRDRDALGG